MIEVNTYLIVFIILGGVIVMEITKHAIAYFWRLLTKTDKYITQQNFKPLLIELITEFMRNWCGNCDSKKNDKDIITIKRLLVKLSIKAGISENEIAELTQ